jgi:hypothetical protein
MRPPHEEEPTKKSSGWSLLSAGVEAANVVE